MSAQDRLRAQLSGRRATPTLDELCAALADHLGLRDHGLAVTGAEVFGRGPSASVDIALSDGSKLTFDRFSDIAKPAALSAHLVTLTGVFRSFKAVEAGAIAAAVFQLATHYAEASADEAAREWAHEYLRTAPTLAVDLNDQSDRWRAFQALARMHPARDAGEDRSAFALAAASTVLVGRDGLRLVRTGWFGAYVKREVGGLYSPAALNAQMQRVGWRRRGTAGRIKATSPGEDGAHLGFNFYVVEATWGDDDGGPGSSRFLELRARAHARTRDRLNLQEPGNPAADPADNPDDPDADRAQALAERNGDLDAGPP